MKKIIIAILGLAIFLSCTKDSPTEPGKENLSFKIGDQQFNVEAVWWTINEGRWRIYWEKSETNYYESVEIDVYGSTVQDYSFSTETAQFSYYKNVGGTVTNIWATTGTLTLSKKTSTEVSGTFSGGMNNASTLTGGSFNNIPYQISDGPKKRK